MEAKDLVIKTRDELLKTSADQHFLKVVNELPDNDELVENLTNYVMNKLLEAARKEGGNMFMGDSSVLNEHIIEFYIDHDALPEDSIKDNWSRYIYSVSDTPTETKPQKEEKSKKEPKSKKEKVEKKVEEKKAFEQLSLFGD